MQFVLAQITSPGARSTNEDSLASRSAQGCECVIMADGAGGHRGGALASAVVVDTVAAAFLRQPEMNSEELKAVIEEADAQLRLQQQSQSGFGDMCSTLVVAVINRSKGTAIWGHVGDTRVYHFRRNELLSVSKDHSVVQQLVDAGLVPGNQIRSHPRRNVLAAALGMKAGSNLAALSSNVMDAPISLADGDALLICTDGFWELVTEADMERALKLAGSAEDWLALMESGLRSRLKPMSDNYSAVALWVGEPQQVTVRM
jgi:serine/threonine protein phosphatase PrpC